MIIIVIKGQEQGDAEADDSHRQRADRQPSLEASVRHRFRKRRLAGL
jgi:hypothetical protein